jgi:hypothetical protein
MPTYKTADRVFETSETTGAGNYDLDGAPIGFQPFAGALGANNLCPYFAEDGVNWEAGIGTVLTAPARLARTHVLASSNGGLAVNWGPGTKNVRCGMPASLAAPRALSKSVAGTGTTILTQDEQRRDVIEFTGALTGNRIIEVDATPWRWIVRNNTTGAFTLTMRVTGQTGVVVPQGGRELLIGDGVDVVSGDLVRLLTTKGDALLRDATGPVRKAVPSNGRVRVAASSQADGWADVPGLRGHLFGLTLSNNVTDAINDIDIAEGGAMDVSNAYYMTLAAGITKRLDAAWAVGTGQGGLDTGTVANGTYHVWLIARSDTGVVDVLFSLSASAPTMPASYDFKRRIGSILRESAAIVGFVQDGDRFMRKLPVLDVNAASTGTAAVTRALSVPTGVRVGAIFTGTVRNTSGASDNCTCVVNDLSQTDLSSINIGQGTIGDGTILDARISSGYNEVMTNTSAQVRTKMQASGANFTLIMYTWGWRDSRGREG